MTGERGKVAHVSMLYIVFDDLRGWLAARGLEVAVIPDSDPDTYVVVPSSMFLHPHTTGAHPDA